MPVYKVPKNKRTKDGREWYFKTSYKDLLGKNKRFESKLYATKKEAQQAERFFLNDKNNAGGTKITIDELYAAYIAQKELEIRPQSLDKLKQQYEHIKIKLGPLQAQSLSLNDYMIFKKEIKAGLSLPYKKKIHNLLKAMYKFGIKFYGLTVNVPDIVGNFKEADAIDKEMQFFTLEEFNIFKNFLKDHIWLTFFEVLFYLGLRKNEANALTWNDINFDTKTVNINKTVVTKLKGKPYVLNSPKTKGSKRELPLPGILLDHLVQLKSEYKKDKSFKDTWFIFGGKRPLSETTIDNVKNKTCKEANLKQIRIHDFRHSCASLLINNGANITLVAKFLGHSDIEMTLNTYGHLYKSQLNEIIKIIDKLPS